jgi:L-asparaginase II
MRPAFWRSSAKPFQALPVLLSGGAAKFHFTSEEVAMICASHGGEPEHVRTVSALLERIGATPEDLACGIHPPSYAPAARAMMEEGKSPTALHNNCSGKHTGMLTLARTLGAPLAGYERPDHLVQQRIRQSVSLMTGLQESELVTGTDGCSVPTFYLPIARMAFAFARMVDPRALDDDVQAASTIIAEAMRLHPYLVSGTGRLEVTLAEASDYRFVAKGGAEAVFCLGIPEKGWGLAVKVDDGMSRTVPSVVIRALGDLGVLSDRELSGLQDVMAPITRNHRGIEVGQMRPVFHLHRSKL